MFTLQRLLVPVTVFALLLITFATAAFWTSASPSASLASSRSFFGSSTSQFHLLLPATASNLDLCKLVLSAGVTGYPDPILLGWGGHGQYNGTESHLFKISETLAYLESLPETADDELVLVLDAYDIWLQLRPDVLISRYFTAVDKANKRLEDQGLLDVDWYGAAIRQSIIFGPDKTCWPDDERRAACWVAPESAMPRDVFGPDTDTWVVRNRARWLNSGTIMGPAKDMRAMFNATMDMVRRKYDEDYEYKTSDQYYFQELWAEQEFARTLRRDGAVDAPLIAEDTYGILPDLVPDARTEFHIALDSESDIFQTSAYYKEYLTWMRFDHASPPPKKSSGLARRIDQFTLTEDVTRSAAPFAAVASGNEQSSKKSWTELMLGTNVITQQVFPVWHMTGEKDYRERWWPKMWFHPHAEALLRASKKPRVAGKKAAYVVAKVNGVKYVAAEMRLKGGFGLEAVEEGHGETMGGAWTDQGEWLDWSNMCGMHSRNLFLNEQNAAQHD